MRKTLFGAMMAGFIILSGCHTITEELPTQATKTPSSGVLTIPIPATIPGATPTPTPKTTPTPGPAATPTPGPAATPTPDPTPTPKPPKGSGCGNPLPPDITRINAKVHLKGPRAYTLDSTPLVGPDREYCAKIGFTDGRSYCPVRVEGDPQRVACETYATGLAADTGRPGPTWRRNGAFCDGVNCDNHPDNQYLLLAYTSGLYEPCAKNGVCGSVQVDK